LSARRRHSAMILVAVGHVAVDGGNHLVAGRTYVMWYSFVVSKQSLIE